MSQVNARILLWGIAGCGKTQTLQTIHAKLRPELRGELRKQPTRLDPTVHYQSLPILLGEVGGVGTQIELVAVPGSADQAMTRKQLLDEVDGIVLVLDCSPERIEENFAAIDELRGSLEAYGRSIDSFPIVLQYNKRDVADPFAIEDLHRRIGLQKAAVFETIATTGHGVLATLTTISKHVVRALRGSSGEITAPAAHATEATPGASQPVEPAVLADAGVAGDDHDILEAAILAEGDAEGLAPAADDAGWPLRDERKPESALGADLRIVSAGQAELDAQGGLRIPLVLGDASGQSRSVVLSLRLDALGGARSGRDD